MLIPDLRFGVWGLVYGTWASYHHPLDPPDASWERNRAQILEAERLGYDCTLIAQHLFNPSGDEHDQLEAWTGTAALAALTDRIELITAIKPYLFHPVVLAKMALQIEAISAGRLALNLVNAWFIPEFEKAGITFADHGERYEYGREWITVVRDLMEGKRTSFTGRWLDVDSYQLRPKDAYRARPAIYAGGESIQAQKLAADTADLFFFNGQPPERIAALIESASSFPRHGADPLRFGMAAYVIARPTEREAADALAYAWELAAEDTPQHESVYRNADPKSTMWQTLDDFPHIGSNGGTFAGLVGSYDTVARRIHEFNRLGVETFMVQFQPFEEDMRTFAQEVIPRVRRLATLTA
jgi:alkanesulfonate monooxygenase